MAPAEGRQGIVFPEILGEERANIPAIEVGEPIAFQTGDRTVTAAPEDSVVLTGSCYKFVSFL
jgi:hypothetical protein